MADWSEVSLAGELLVWAPAGFGIRDGARVRGASASRLGGYDACADSGSSGGRIVARRPGSRRGRCVAGEAVLSAAERRMRRGKINRRRR